MSGSEGVAATMLEIARLESDLNKARARLSVWKRKERAEEQAALAEQLGVKASEGVGRDSFEVGETPRSYVPALFRTTEYGMARRCRSFCSPLRILHRHAGKWTRILIEKASRPLTRKVENLSDESPREAEGGDEVDRAEKRQKATASAADAVARPKRQAGAYRRRTHAPSLNLEGRTCPQDSGVFTHRTARTATRPLKPVTYATPVRIKCRSHHRE